MDEFVAPTSRSQTAYMVVGSLVFVAIGIWMAGLLGVQPVSRRGNSEIVIIIGWICITFFGFCAVAWSKEWWDNNEQLRINRQGILFYRWSNQVIPWEEIENVTEWGHRKQRFIILHLRRPWLFPGRGLMSLTCRVVTSAFHFPELIAALTMPWQLSRGLDLFIAIDESQLLYPTNCSATKPTPPPYAPTVATTCKPRLCAK